MRRVRLKRKIKKQNLIIITFFLMIISIIFMISFINNKVTPMMIEIIEPEITRLSTIVVNNAINRVLEEKFNNLDFFTTVLSNDGKIQTIDFNSIVVNKILSIATTAAQNDLRLLEEGNLENVGMENIKLSQTKIERLKKGIITEIPIGLIFNNSLLSNIGPRVPVRLHYVGSVNSNIVTKVSPYGINNALVEIGIKLQTTVQIVFPLSTQKINLDCYIPITIKVIQGNIPNYYSNGIENQSQLYSLPF